ncbi:hypothetical protein JL722_8958 [Aureococcus anophagefferens]|nr:hypothetical protein JL722_8958 [Aureococcus anophagefferens]
MVNPYRARSWSTSSSESSSSSESDDSGRRRRAKKSRGDDGKGWDAAPALDAVESALLMSDPAVAASMGLGKAAAAALAENPAGGGGPVSASSEKQQRRRDVYVGNLIPNTTSEALAGFFDGLLQALAQALPESRAATELLQGGPPIASARVCAPSGSVEGPANRQRTDHAFVECRDADVASTLVRFNGMPASGIVSDKHNGIRINRPKGYAPPPGGDVCPVDISPEISEALGLKPQHPVGGGAAAAAQLIESMAAGNLANAAAAQGKASLATPGPTYVCHRCGIGGHFVQDCPTIALGIPGIGAPPPGYVCHRCGVAGHYVQDCVEIKYSTRLQCPQKALASAAQLAAAQQPPGAAVDPETVMILAAAQQQTALNAARQAAAQQLAASGGSNSPPVHLDKPPEKASETPARIAAPPPASLKEARYKAALDSGQITEAQYLAATSEPPPPPNDDAKPESLKDRWEQRKKAAQRDDDDRRPAAPGALVGKAVKITWAHAKLHAQLGVAADWDAKAARYAVRLAREPKTVMLMAGHVEEVRGENAAREVFDALEEQKLRKEAAEHEAANAAARAAAEPPKPPPPPNNPQAYVDQRRAFLTDLPPPQAPYAPPLAPYGAPPPPQPYGQPPAAPYGQYGQPEATFTPRPTNGGVDGTSQRKVYVCNIHPDAADADLATALSAFGAVRDALVCRTLQGSPRGFGYVTFGGSDGDQAAAVERAVAAGVATVHVRDDGGPSIITTTAKIERTTDREATNQRPPEPAKPPRDMTNRVSGMCLWFDHEKNFGFLVPDGGGDNRFIHGLDVQGERFSKGDKVTFALGKDPDGRLKAVEAEKPAAPEPEPAPDPMDRPLPEPSPGRAVAYVKWYDAKRQFGFVGPTLDERDKAGDVFVHEMDLLCPLLHRGDIVEYSPGEGSKGEPKACDVKLFAPPAANAPFGYAPAAFDARNPSAPLGRRAQGVVKWFDNNEKKYGFLQPDAGGEGVFAHRIDFRMPGGEAVGPGDRVEYTAGVSPENGRPKAFEIVKVAARLGAPPHLAVEPAKHPAVVDGEFIVEDPYDPANPNDYVEIQKQKELAKAYERREKQRQVHLEKLEAEQARLAEERQRAAKRAMESGDLGAMSGLGLGSGNQMGRGRGVSNLPAWMKTRKAEPPKPAPAPAPEEAFESAFDDGDVAPAPAAAPSAQPNIVPTLASRPLKTPTRVLLLKNMVAPDEMDAEFGKETRSECGKYGAVEADDVFLAPHAPEDEAVRVFLAFSEKKHAIRAFLDMEGRFFGGRRITAGFDPEDRFAARDLAPGNDPV